MANRQSKPKRKGELERLRTEKESLRAELEESKQTLEAIRSGAVDALVIETPKGQRIFSLEGAERPYRELIEQMQEGAATLARDGTIQYCNRAFASLLKRPMQALVGSPLEQHIRESDREAFQKLMHEGRICSAHGEVGLSAGGGQIVHVHLGVTRVTDGGEASVCVVATDLVERKQHEARILQLNAELEERVTQRTAELQTANLRLASEAAERRRAAESAEQQRQLLAVTLASIGDAVIVTDAKGRVTFLNAEAERLTGWRGRDAQGQSLPSVFNIVNEETRQAVENPVDKVLRLGTVVGLANHTVLIAKDGTETAIDDSAALIRQRDNTVQGVVLVFRDFSEQKAAQKALRESEERFRTMADAMSQLAWSAHADGYIHWYNRRWYEYTGTTPQRMEGWGWQSVHDPKMLPEVMERWKASLASGEPFEMEFPLRGADGNFRRFLTRGMPLKDAEGRVVQWFGTNTDVDELSRAQEALSESEHRFRSLFENALDAKFLTIPDGTVLAANPAACAMFRMSEDELCRVGLAGITNPADPRHAEVTAERERAGKLTTELTYVRKDGTVFPAEVQSVVLGNEQQQSFLVLRDISERKRIEEGLARAQRLVQSIIGNTTAIVYAFDLEERFMLANAPLARLLNSTPEQLIGRRRHEFMPREDADWHEANDRQVIEAGRTLDFEEHSQLQGRSITWLTTKFPLRDGQGSIYAVAGISADVSDRKRTEEALRQTNERLQKVLEVEAVGVMFWDLTTGRLVDANDTFLKMMGYSRADIETQDLTWQKFTPLEYHEMSRAEVAKFMATGRVGPYEKEYFRKDGTRQWLLFAGSSLGGNRCVEFCVDISERKRAEEALRQSESRFRVVQELSPDGFTILRPIRDAEGRVIDFTFVYENAAIARLNHTDTEAIVGRRLLEVFPNHAASAFHRAYEHVAQTGEPQVLEGAYEGDSIQTKTWFRVAVVRIDEDIAVLAQDVTQRKQSEDALAAAKHLAEEAKLAAEAASKAKDHFLAVLSHELRNPLTPVLPSLAALEKLVPEEGREFLEIARRNVDLEARLIDDLLDVTRIARGKIELERNSVELCTILRHAADVCRPDIEARRLHFGIEIEGSPHYVHADSARLQQVFWNLIKNAVKFTPHGGCVGVKAWRKDGRAFVQVTDSGEGIEPQSLDRIFNAFEQEALSTTRQFGGLGLGLAISKALVELHGGAIRAHSEGKGRGATFTVELPIHEAPAEAGQRGAPAPAVPSVEHRAKILLVEDHGDTARVMPRLLTAQGHTVKHAGDVATALELAESEVFDVLVSDLGLPDGSGHDLMRQLMAAGKRMPAIALSGYGMAADVKQSHDAGFTEHVTKPVNMESLIAALDRVMKAGMAGGAAGTQI